MKLYESKKDSSVQAKLVQQNKKFGTVIIEYVTGDNVGKNISISEATLKRWWRNAGEVEETSETAEEVAPEPEKKEPELVTKVRVPGKARKDIIPAIDRDSKVEYLQLLAKRYPDVTIKVKESDKYELIFSKSDVRLGKICVKLRKFVCYTNRVLTFKNISDFIVSEVTGMAKIEGAAEDALLETLFTALIESEDRE